MGVEIDGKLVKEANENAAKAGVGDRVKFVQGDLFKADVGDATVVTLYLLPSMLGDVEEKLAKELKPGTRVDLARLSAAVLEARRRRRVRHPREGADLGNDADRAAALSRPVEVAYALHRGPEL